MGRPTTCHCAGCVCSPPLQQQLSPSPGQSPPRAAHHACHQLFGVALHLAHTYRAPHWLVCMLPHQLHFQILQGRHEHNTRTIRCRRMRRPQHTCSRLRRLQCTCSSASAMPAASSHATGQAPILLIPTVPCSIPGRLRAAEPAAPSHARSHAPSLSEHPCGALQHTCSSACRRASCTLTSCR